MGGSAIDGLIFADFRATNPLVVQISQLFRPSRLSTWSPADCACALSVFEDESINNVHGAAGLFRIIEYYRSVWLAIKAATT